VALSEGRLTSEQESRGVATLRPWITLTCRLATTTTPAFDTGRYGEFRDNIRSWFKSVRSPNGVLCRHIAGGRRTTWDKRTGDDRYWVPIEGEWASVSPETVVYNAGNPTGEAVVWYVSDGATSPHGSKTVGFPTGNGGRMLHEELMA
jgi:hypothetical protein